jgi:small-conductance mechanosensitive channel
MGVWRVLAQRPSLLLVPSVVFAITLGVAWVLRRVLLASLRAWNRRTNTRPGLIVTEALDGPTVIWMFILAGHLAIQSSELPAKIVQDWGPNLLMALWAVSLTLMFMRVAGDIVRHYGGQIPGAGVLPVTTLTQNLAQLAVLILGIVLTLGAFGLKITPILTALGVGGLAVALALQDTLSNLFAGFYIAVAGQVRLGDYIKLNSGEEGYITDITWRSTAVRNLSNNMIIIPNAKLGQAIVTNYYLPEKRLSVSIQVSVSYGSDLDRVERILMEIATQGAREIPGMLADPVPSVSFDPGFGDSSLGLTLGYQVAEFANQYGVRNELRKRIYKRFQEENITMPFPTRTVYLEGAPLPQELKPDRPQGRL